MAAGWAWVSAATKKMITLILAESLDLTLGGGVLTGGVGAVQGLVLTATYLFTVWAGAKTRK